MEKKNNENLIESLTNPEILKQNLIIASLFITSYEILINSIIDPIFSFFSDTYTDKKGWLKSNKYESEVLSLNRKNNQLFASIEWLKKENIIDQYDHDVFEEIRKCRNYLAHELASYIQRPDSAKPIELLPEIIRLISKIDKWWIINVEMPINPDFGNQEINENAIISGSEFVLKVIIEIALESEQVSKN